MIDTLLLWQGLRDAAEHCRDMDAVLRANKEVKTP